MEALSPVKLHGRWLIICGLCITHCFLIEAKEFWYTYIFMYGCYCKYYNDLGYKAPISSMVVMLSCGFSF